MVEWFLREFGHAEEARAAELGIPPHEVLDELLASVPPGSIGLTLQPTGPPGSRVPGPEAKGAIIGFGDVHTRAHVYRAILEGLAYALREGMERTEKKTGVKVDRAARRRGRRPERRGRPARRRTSSGSRSRGRTRTRRRGSAPRSTRRSASASTPTSRRAVREMTRVASAREPDPPRHALYDELYAKVYRRMYGGSSPLYEEIRRITGYPGSPQA